MAKEYVVGVVGAHGVVGTQIISFLEKRNFPVSEFVPLDIAAMAGKELTFKGKSWVTKEAKEGAFKDLDIVLFAAGGAASAALAPVAAKEGALVVDNSSNFRMDPEVPLVVPEVNAQDLDWNKGIIANPNCSTTQMVVALKPLHDAANITRVVVSTYQAVSGGGGRAIAGMKEEFEELATKGRVSSPKVYKKQIMFNAIPHIDVFEEGGYTKEEYKMVNETKKMLGEGVKVTATCVRIPVWYGHSETINIQTEKKLTVEQARELLKKAPGLLVIDNPDEAEYPTPLESDDQDLTMIGRIREDFTIENGLNMWVVSNNIRKGAALNAVQIAETLVERNLV
ncbi:MAG: aspartate-semialdehyde dehydrogenase [Sphaerochaetaceae bacterium]|jgi:aspartate-semialdehyde dehydrogenase